MKAALISLGSVSSQMISEELKTVFDTVDDLDLREFEVSISGKTGQVLYEGKPLEKYDAIYARGSFRYANLLRAITQMLSKQCYMPLKASTFTTCHDKVQTHIKLQRNKVPQPKTYLASTADAGKKIIKKLTL